LRPPPERDDAPDGVDAGAAAAGAAPGAAGRVSPIEGRVSPILGRSGAAGVAPGADALSPLADGTGAAAVVVTGVAGPGIAEEDDGSPAPGAGAVPVGGSVVGSVVGSFVTGVADREAARGTPPSVGPAASSATPGAPPASPPPVLLLPRPPREPRRRRLPVPGPPGVPGLLPLPEPLPEPFPEPPPEPLPDCAPGCVPPDPEVVDAEPVDGTGAGPSGRAPVWGTGPFGSAGRVASGTRAGDADGVRSGGLVGDEGGDCAPGVCPSGASDIEFPSETAHDARSMACRARSAPAGIPRPRSGSSRSPSRTIH